MTTRAIHLSKAYESISSKKGKKTYNHLGSDPESYLLATCCSYAGWPINWGILTKKHLFLSYITEAWIRIIIIMIVLIEISQRNRNLAVLQTPLSPHLLPKGARKQLQFISVHSKIMKLETWRANPLQLRLSPPAPAASRQKTLALHPHLPRKQTLTKAVQHVKHFHIIITESQSGFVGKGP